MSLLKGKQKSFETGGKSDWAEQANNKPDKNVQSYPASTLMTSNKGCNFSSNSPQKLKYWMF